MIIDLGTPPKKLDADKKRDTYEVACALYQGWVLTLHGLKSGTFPIKVTQGEERKILTPK